MASYLSAFARMNRFHTALPLVLVGALGLPGCGTAESGNPTEGSPSTSTAPTSAPTSGASNTSSAASTNPVTTSGGTSANTSTATTTTTNPTFGPSETTNLNPTNDTGTSSSSNASPTTASTSDPTSGDATSTSPDVPTGMLTVSELKIEANPKMELSCFVSWKTSEPANSEVQFGVDGYQLHIVDTELVTEHRVHVIGMHAETAYNLKAVSTTETAIGSAEGTFTTGSTPPGLPATPTVVGDQVDKMQPGWTLTNLHVGGSSNFSTEPAHIVILDEQGLPVWYFIHGTTADQFGMTSTEWLPDGHLLIGNASSEPAREIDLEANVLWEGPTGGSPAMSHHTSKLANGNYVVVRESNTSARLEEINPEHEVVWSWDLYDHMQPTTTAADWCHANAVTLDPEEKFFYFNCRFQGLFKVDRSDGSLVWQMGAAIDDSNSGSITYLPDNGARFNDAHDPDVYGDRVAIFYDNQGWASHMGGEGNGTFHSRVVMYQLNEAETEASLIWEFPGTFDVDPWYKDEWETPIWGDADRLENGNVLVTAGVRGAGTHTRVFEVTPEGEVVWGIEWPENNGSYRADRIPAVATKLE